MTSGASSTFTLTTRTSLSAMAMATSSRIGAIMWQGAHQGAQKSTTATPSLLVTRSSKLPSSAWTMGASTTVFFLKNIFASEVRRGSTQCS